jgi:predicted nuclease of predicted toxin-antitoxin system
MKFLLDECLPRRLVRDLNRYSVTTVSRQGWSGVTDTELLKLAGAEFDILITMDSNLVFQQNMKLSDLRIIVLRAFNSRYETLQILVPDILNAIEKIQPGQIIAVGSPEHFR